MVRKTVFCSEVQEPGKYCKACIPRFKPRRKGVFRMRPEMLTADTSEDRSGQPHFRPVESHGGSAATQPRVDTRNSAIFAFSHMSWFFSAILFSGTRNKLPEESAESEGKASVS